MFNNIRPTRGTFDKGFNKAWSMIPTPYIYAGYSRSFSIRSSGGHHSQLVDNISLVSSRCRPMREPTMDEFLLLF